MSQIEEGLTITIVPLWKEYWVVSVCLYSSTQLCRVTFCFLWVRGLFLFLEASYIKYKLEFTVVHPPKSFSLNMLNCFLKKMWFNFILIFFENIGLYLLHRSSFVLVTLAKTPYHRIISLSFFLRVPYWQVTTNCKICYIYHEQLVKHVNFLYNFHRALIMNQYDGMNRGIHS